LHGYQGNCELYSHINNDTSPLSDEMKINNAAAVERARKAAQKRDFEALLKALPAPKYKYKISAPPESKKDDEEDEDEDDDDMTEKANKQERVRKSTEKALLACCSTGMKRGLPRILRADGIQSLFTDNSDADDEKALAERLISAELRSTVEFELHHFNPDSDRVNIEPFANRNTGASTERQTEVTLSEQRSAASLIEKEAGINDELEGKLNDAWDDAFRQAVFVNSHNGESGSWLLRDTLNPKQRTECSKNNLARLRKLVERQRTVNDKQTQRLSVYLGGYEKRVTQQSRLLDASYKRLEQAQLERSCFTYLRNNELRAIPVRVSDLQSQLSIQESIERGLQQTYASITA